MTLSRRHLVQHLFAEAVDRFPRLVACQSRDRSVTYLELEERANRLANFLRAHGLGKGSIVAVLTTDSLALIESILGVLKAGGAFVPLEPSQPRNRLLSQIAEVTPDLLIAEPRCGVAVAHCLERLPELRVLPMGREGAESSGDLAERWSGSLLSGFGDFRQTRRPDVAYGGDDFCYVYFTSGSTGRPKGTMGRLAAIGHFVQWETKTFGVGEGTRVSQLSAFSFDAFLRDVFVPLCAGGVVCLPERADGRLAVSGIGNWIDEQKIHLVHCVPSLFRALMDEGLTASRFSALRRILLAGEPLYPADVRRWMEVYGERVELVNLYGPSETTMVKLFYRITAADRERATIPIGRPMDGARALVVDHRNRPQAPGRVGEIILRTPFRSLGYFGQEELTREVFVRNPFSDDPLDLIYRTGDLGRRLDDGNLEFLGRLDQQVKIRGVRVELGEIETRLRSLDSVRDAVVVVREAPAGAMLVAYVVPAVGGEAEDWRLSLSEWLPELMIPSHFVVLDEVPRTLTGKVDRRALPAPPSGRSCRRAPPVAPRTALEARLVAMFQDVLGTAEEVGIRDGFFDFGGQSLQVLRLLARIRGELGVELPLATFFAGPTVEETAKVVAAGLPGAGPRLEPVDREGDIPLSFAQQRMWFLDRLYPGGALYNMAVAVRFEGSLDRAALQWSLDQIVRRHEVLRTTFRLVDDRAVQRVAPSAGAPMPSVDLRRLPRAEREAEMRRNLVAEALRPVDVERGPLLRVTGYHVADRELVVLLVMHHIVADLRSLSIFIEELGALYGARGREAGPEPLPPPPIQYADYAIWQRRWAEGGGLEGVWAYWKRQLGDDFHVARLPVERSRKSQPSFRGTRLPLVLPRRLYGKLHALAKVEVSTVFTVLLTALKMLIRRYTAASDVVVATSIEGRDRPELEDLIGFFVNTLVLRSRISGDPTCEDFLAHVQQVTLEAFTHQAMPFEELLQRLRPGLDTSRSPLFQVAFDFRASPLPDLRLPGIRATPIEIDTGLAKQELTFFLADTGDEIVGSVELSRDLFDETTVTRLVRHYGCLLEGVVDAPGRPLSAQPVLTPAERHQSLVDWNATSVPVPVPGFHRLFEDRADLLPEAVALVSEHERFTYRKLDAETNRLAHLLCRRGVGREGIVGVHMRPSLELVTAFLGILKAGGAYLPLDPAYPSARLSYMIEDSEAVLILARIDPSDRADAPEADVPVATIDRKTLSTEPAARLASHGNPRRLAYLIYTSGSTGRPKGTLIEHRGLCNLARAESRSFGIGPGSSMLLFASPSFDASISEMAMGFGGGAALHVAARESLLPGPPLRRLLKERRITSVNLPPSAMTVLSLDELPDLRSVIFAGEACPVEVLESASAPGRRVFNAYGPTEDSVCATAWELEAGAPSTSIGGPLDNQRVYLLGERLEPLPTGVPGELHIAGIGLARGYLHRPGLTAEKFIPDPFASEPGARLYRTGDRCRFLARGNLEFCGRLDAQIKLRGFRIEPGEIEAVLRRHPTVRDAAVVLQDDGPESRHLVAYVVSETEGAPRERGVPELWPSVAGHFVYDELLYHAMTHDERKRASYRYAIHRSVENKVVLDLGTGRDAVLARMCVEAGAKRVYALELLEDDYRFAVQRVRELGLEDRIVVLQGASTEVVLPEQVDVCVSEIFGSIGGSEGAAVVLNDARRFLKPGGLMIPHRSVTRVAAIELPDDLEENPRFYGLAERYVEKIFQRYGEPFDLRLCIKNFPKENIVSNAETFEELDFSNPVETSYRRPLRFRLDRRSRFSGFLVWLNLHTFDGEVIDIMEPGHSWLPVYLPIFHPAVELAAGELIEVEVSGQISNDGVNPDYLIRGRVVRREGRPLEFEHRSDHRSKSFRQTPFHEALFPFNPFRQSHPDPVSYAARRFLRRLGEWLPEGSELAKILKSGAGSYGGPLDLAPAESLRDYLARHLPSHMVPSFFVPMDALPLTPSRKIDRRALPAVDANRQVSARVLTPPRDVCELELLEIWRDLLKVQHFGVTDDFFDLGGNSLLVISMVGRIEKRYGHKLPLTMILEGATVERLAAALRRASPAAAPSLVCLAKGALREPLFCVHPIGGNVLGYLPLSRRMARSQPIYAFQAPGADGLEEPVGRVEDLAECFIGTLRSVQPEGPYFLAGHSFGGLVAFEMARRLLTLGHEIAFLGILDTPAPTGSSEAEEVDDAEWLARRARILERFTGTKLVLSRDELEPLEPQARMDFFLERMREAGHLPPDADRRLVSAILRVQKASHEAAHRYSPAPYAGRVDLFRASISPDDSLESDGRSRSVSGWKSLTTGPLIVHDVPGDHVTMLIDPNVQALADLLQAQVDRARSSQTAGN